MGIDSYVEDQHITLVPGGLDAVGQGGGLDGRSIGNLPLGGTEEIIESHQAYFGEAVGLRGYGIPLNCAQASEAGCRVSLFDMGIHRAGVTSLSLLEGQDCFTRSRKRGGGGQIGIAGISRSVEGPDPIVISGRRHQPVVARSDHVGADSGDLGPACCTIATLKISWGSFRLLMSSLRLAAGGTFYSS